MARFALSLTPTSDAVNAAISAAATASADASAALAAAEDAAAGTDALATALGTGAGQPVKLDSAPLTGTGSEQSVAVEYPVGYSPSNGHKIVIGGTLRVVDDGGEADDGRHVATIHYEGVVLRRAGGAWVLDSRKDAVVVAGEPLSGDPARALVPDYYAVASTDLPMFGDDTGGLALFHTLVDGEVVTLEGDFTIALN